MSYITIKNSRRGRTCGKCRTRIEPKDLHVEVINVPRTTFICSECICKLYHALFKAPYEAVWQMEGDISKSDISV